VLRASWLPARLANVLALLQSIDRPDARAAFTGRAMGVGLLRLEGAEPAHRAAIARLRDSADVGHVVVLRASRELRAAIDPWGPPRESETVAHALKQMFDPKGILNAGRGPV
jgi:hypothetical protein